MSRIYSYFGRVPMGEATGEQAESLPAARRGVFLRRYRTRWDEKNQNKVLFFWKVMIWIRAELRGVLLDGRDTVASSSLSCVLTFAMPRLAAQLRRLCPSARRVRDSRVTSIAPSSRLLRRTPFRYNGSWVLTSSSC